MIMIAETGSKSIYDQSSVFPELVISYEVRNFEVDPVTKILSS